MGGGCPKAMVQHQVAPRHQATTEGHRVATPEVFGTSLVQLISHRNSLDAGFSWATGAFISVELSETFARATQTAHLEAIRL